MSSEANEFDVVVVGGGSAGSVLAARLSEDPEVRVLLVEAGSATPPDAAAVPPAWPSLVQGPASWNDMTVEQGATGTRTLLPRGRVLGGSSTINAMLFARGHRSSYDAWSRFGVKGWGFEDLLPYFQRSENARHGDPALRGTDGPLTVRPAQPPNEVLLACLEAAVEKGHRRAVDISGGIEEGFAPTDLNIVDGRRQSAADAYLTPALGRANLTVVTDALVHRLRMENGRCTGVDYTVDGRTVRADAAREVVLAAGAIGTPQLLMVSGIGPADHLRQVGVEVVHDLPGVGSNFHDHPQANVVYSSDRPVPPGRNNHGEIFGLVRSSSEAQAPDLQIIFIDVPPPIPGFEVPAHGYTLAVSPMTPHSRGTVRLAGSRPDLAPVLDPDYFGDERDMATMIAGLAIAREIGGAHALQEWRGHEVAPGATTRDYTDLRTYVAGTLNTYCHPVGTCAMGDGPQAVVDSELRVHGLLGLRIADGSVIPSIPSSNTNATVYAIAERAAEMIAAAG